MGVTPQFSSIEIDGIFFMKSTSYWVAPFVLETTWQEKKDKKGAHLVVTVVLETLGANFPFGVPER